MSQKVKIVICTGTHCFVMGGSDLLLLEDHVPEGIKQNVSIEGSNCLGFCEDRTKGKAPFVEINGVLMEQATIPKILKYLDLMKG
jgi:NADH:ubiquinone oxidoreductase subunit E